MWLACVQGATFVARSRETGMEHRIAALAGTPGFVVFNGEGVADKRFLGAWKEYAYDDVQVFSKQITTVVRAAGWEVNVTSKPIYNGLPGNAEWRFDVNMRPLDDIPTLAAKHGSSTIGTIAPHGIIGQSFDNDDIAVIGALDKYTGLTEMTTKAQAEGFIEGNFMDYKMTEVFATAFKFSRFDARLPVPPRNVSALTGTKMPRGHKAEVAKAEEDEEAMAKPEAKKMHLL